jgi:hypothetical protein
MANKELQLNSLSLKNKKELQLNYLFDVVIFNLCFVGTKEFLKERYVIR